MAIDPKLRKALPGISGILVTPFDDQDKVAPGRLKPIIDRAVRAGVHILVANGNTGFNLTLTGFVLNVASGAIMSTGTTSNGTTTRNKFLGGIPEPEIH